MRAVLHQDVVALARCLLRCPENQRRSFAHQQISRAHLADLYRIRFGISHPKYGTGTLASSCQGYAKDVERRLDDPDYGKCLIIALSAILRFRHRAS